MAIDPHQLFETWFAEARIGEPHDAEAMTLATADASGRPAARMVLLKGHDERGFVFYTNGESRKGAELAANPRAALLFHWKSLRRQVRIEGAVAPVSDAEADAYFATRARDSQIGAWASDQSRRSPAAPRSRRAPAGSTVIMPARTCRGRRIGGAIGSSPTGSNSGPTGRTGCTSGVCSRSARPGGAKACSTMSARAALTTRAALASVSAATLLPRSNPTLPGRPDRWRCSARSPIPRSTCLPRWSRCSRSGRRPAGRPRARFRHSKAEALAALAQIVLISISAIGIGWRAIDRLIAHERTANAGYGIAVSIVAILVTLALVAYQRSVVRRTGSVAIRTDNVHYQSDLFLNLSVIAALALDQYAGFPSADPLFGLAIACG